MTMINPIDLHTERLVLKPVSLGDVPCYEKHFIDYEVIRHLSDTVPWPYPENGVREYVQNQILPEQGRDRWIWGIHLRGTPDHLIGVVELWRPGKPENRGFWLGHEHWGKGYMNEAAYAVTDYAFADLGFDTLIFSNARGNVRSRRVKEKTGARLLRTEPAEFVDPEYTEQEIWELTRDDWIAFRQGG